MQTPGEVLQKKLVENAMTRKELSTRTGFTEKHISTVISGDRGISIAFARKLGLVFNDFKFWIELQSEYENGQLELKEKNDITPQESDIFRKHLKDISSFFVDRGFMKNDCDEATKIIRLRETLKISSLLDIPKITYYAAYKAQLSKNVKVDPYVLFAWQRLCELETEKTAVEGKPDLEKLRTTLPSIKELMFEKPSVFHVKLQKLFSSCGISFKVVRNFKGAPVHGFIKKTVSDGLILCVTIRGKRADTFWFTLFHEIGHVLHQDYENRFVDFDSISSRAEDKANEFARNFLIDEEEYGRFIQAHEHFSTNDIKEFAKSVNVEPFIVLGRLQRDELVDWSEHQGLLKQYSWS